MPINFTRLDPASVLLTVGRGLIFRAPVWTPADGPLSMTNFGMTEGDISVAKNPEMAKLTLPELTGPAAHEYDFMGEDPVITVPMIVADPTFQASLSPMGTAHGGRSFRGAVAEHTVAIIPEGVFLKDDGTFGTLSLSGGSWLLDASPLGARGLTLLASSFWGWRAVVNRPPQRFRGGGGDDSKNLEDVSIMLMHHPDMPEGHHLYTIGNPLAAGINIEVGAS